MNELRHIKVFHTSASGFGCYESEKSCSPSDIIEETDIEVVIVERWDYGGSKATAFNRYCKNIDEFIRQQEGRFNARIERLTWDRDVTLHMAKEIKRKSDIV